MLMRRLLAVILPLAAVAAVAVVRGRRRRLDVWQRHQRLRVRRHARRPEARRRHRHDPANEARPDPRRRAAAAPCISSSRTRAR